MTQYVCPSCGMPIEVDTADIPWHDDGTAPIIHNSCGSEITIARPVSVGFGGGDAT